MSEENETVALSEIEDAASKQGWSPDKGDLGALEFLSKGREFRDRLYDKVGKLEKENQKVYQIVTDHITKLDKKDHERDKKDHKTEQEGIEAKIREASEAGETDKVIELTKQVKSEPEEQKADPNIAFIDKFKEDNPWFVENSEMRADALGFYNAESQKVGSDDPSIILPIVLKRIKKEYPDKFTSSNPNKDRGSGADKGGKVKTSKKDGLTMDDLSEDESRHLDDFIALGMSKESLLASIQRGRT